jgi:hypothetical protein
MKATRVRLWFALVPALILFAALCGSGWKQAWARPAASSSADDAVKAAPKNYKLHYEDQHIRLVEVVVRPGETENVHTDPYPLVIARDAVAPTKLKDTAPPPVVGQGPAPKGMEFPTCTTMGPQAAHAITNNDTFPLHYYRIEFKRIDGKAYETNWKTGYPWMLDPIKPVKDVAPPADAKPFSTAFPFPIAYDSYIAAPNNHYMRYQDDHVRFLEVTFRSGERENLHGHPYPSVFEHDFTGPAQSTDNADGPLTEPGLHRKADGTAMRTSVPDVKLIADSPMNGQNSGQGPAPAGMEYPTCNTMGPQAPHKAYNGRPYPTHFYRLEFRRLDGQGIKTHWKEWYPWMVQGQ